MAPSVGLEVQSGGQVVLPLPHTLRLVRIKLVIDRTYINNAVSHCGRRGDGTIGWVGGPERRGRLFCRGPTPSRLVRIKLVIDRAYIDNVISHCGRGGGDATISWVGGPERRAGCFAAAHLPPCMHKACDRKSLYRQRR